MNWSSPIGREIFLRMIEIYRARPNISMGELAQVLSEEFDVRLTRHQVRHKLERSQEDILSIRPKTVFPHLDKYSDFIYHGARVRKAKVKLPRQQTKILVLNDMHIPHHDEEIIGQAINLHRDADVVVITEPADMTSKTPFTPDDTTVFEYELDEILRVFELLDKIFPAVYIISGNHGNRVQRRIQHSLDRDLWFLMDMDIMEVLCRPFAHLHPVQGWLVQVNDAVFTHYERSSKIPQRIANNVYDVIREHRKVFGVKFPVRLVVQGHNHQHGRNYREHGEVLIASCGHLFKSLPNWYLRKPNNVSWTKGYMVVIQEDGQTKFDLVKDYVFPTVN